jgi:Undecaprenyl-phosphate glucose phosphotransferase
MKGQGQKLGLCFLGSDMAVAALSWLAAYWLRFPAELGPPPPNGAPPFEWCLRGLPLILLLTMLSCRMSGLYHLHRLRRLRQEFPGILRANAILFLLLIAITFYRKDPYKSRLAMGMFLVINIVGLAAARRAAWSLVHYLRGRGFNPSRAIIVGSGRMAQKLARILRANAWTGLEVIGFVDDGTRPSVLDIPVLGGIEQLSAIAELEQVGYVFVALPLARFGDMRTVMDQLADTLADVRLVPDVPNLAAASLSVSELSGLPVVGLRENPHNGVNRLVKRAMDVAIAATALVVLSPVFLIIALAIKLTSRGPVFYRQDRAGLAGESFQMLKFRSMHADAEHQTGPVWAAENDPRRTRLGQFLRSTSLDELPQFVNVLKGDMSLVGPRPERPVFIHKFRGTVPHYMLRHTVKAGITGWAQIHGWRGNTSLRKRVQYDLYYIAHWTPWLDLRIMILTLVRGMINRNAY